MKQPVFGTIQPQVHRQGMLSYPVYSTLELIQVSTTELTYWVRVLVDVLAKSLEIGDCLSLATMLSLHEGTPKKEGSRSNFPSEATDSTTCKLTNLPCRMLHHTGEEEVSDRCWPRYMTGERYLLGSLRRLSPPRRPVPGNPGVKLNYLN